MKLTAEEKKARKAAIDAAYHVMHKEERKARDAARYAANKEELRARQRARYATHKKEIRAQKAAYDATHKEEIKARKAAYNATHKEEIKARSAAYRTGRTELASVGNHYASICGTKTKPPQKNYEGMPFHETWDPKKGGSFQTGADWIIATLGKRPEGCSLHIVDHAKGFVPGNLEWTHRTKQNAEQMFKIIANQKNEIKRQKQKINTLGTLVFRLVHKNQQERL
jgi:hypothetical protein